jgi:putative alpha-1,2-mannosidase
MSAWYVLSAMGFYPVCPGTPSYSIGSPIFSQVVIHLTNGKSFTVLARGSSTENQFVRTVTVNGKARSGWKFDHQELMQGATLSLQMNSQPGSEEQ